MEKQQQSSIYQSVILFDTNHQNHRKLLDQEDMIIKIVTLACTSLKFFDLHSTSFPWNSQKNSWILAPKIHFFIYKCELCHFIVNIQLIFTGLPFLEILRNYWIFITRIFAPNFFHRQMRVLPFYREYWIVQCVL